MKPDERILPYTILLKVSAFGFNAASEDRGIVLLEGIQTRNVERVHDVEGQRTKVLLPFQTVDEAIQQLEPLLESLKGLKSSS